MAAPTQVRLATADGVTVVANMFRAENSGLSYLVAHGFTGSSQRPEVVEIARTLHDLGASVLVPDFRGHGLSGGKSTIGDAEVHDIAAAVDWLRAERPDDKIVTVGFSMGASVVVRYAGLGGSPDAVVAVSGPGRWYERGTESMRRLHYGVETALGRVVLRRVFKTRVAVAAWQLLPIAPVEAARHVTVPMLVVHGDADRYFGLEHGRMLAAAAPHADLWVEEGMGHAESATTPELIARIDAWSRRAAGASANMTA